MVIREPIFIVFVGAIILLILLIGLQSTLICLNGAVEMGVKVVVGVSEDDGVQGDTGTVPWTLFSAFWTEALECEVNAACLFAVLGLIEGGGGVLEATSSVESLAVWVEVFPPARVDNDVADIRLGTSGGGFLKI